MPKSDRKDKLDANITDGATSLAGILSVSRRSIRGAVVEYTAHRGFATNAVIRNKLYNELAAEYKILNSNFDDWVESEVKITSKNFWKYAKEDLPRGAVAGTFGAFSEKYVDDIIGVINPASMSKQIAVNARIGGMLTEDIRALRAAVSTTIAEGAVEGLTNKELARRMIGKVNKSVGQFRFVDKAGRRWTGDSYFGMVNRTLHATAARESYIAAATKEAGFDLYTIDGGFTGSSADNAADPCDAWQGRVVSMTGATAGFPTYGDALGAGVFHPSCVHFVSVLSPAESKAATGPAASESLVPAQTVGEAEPVKFVPASSIKDAEKYAINSLNLQYVSFKGLDLKVANDMNKATLKMKTLMPKIQTNGIGSAQAANKAMKDDIIGLYKKSDTYTYYVDKLGVKTADKAAKSYASRFVGRVGPGEIAWSTNRGVINLGAIDASIDVSKYKGVFVSTKFGKSADLIDDAVSKGEATGWFTKDAKGIGHIMSHEFGHEIDKTIGFRESAGFRAIYNREHAKGIDSVIKDLSKYGATAGGNARHKAAEMIAEGWAEFTMAPNPRRLAKEIGNEMLSAYHSVHKSDIGIPLEKWKTQVLRSIAQ